MAGPHADSVFTTAGPVRQVCYLGPPVGLKRLLFLLVVATVCALGAVAAAPAGVGIADEPCPTVAGEHTNTCPVGTVGVPYAIQYKEAEGSGCGPGKQTFTIDSGTFPPGLSLASSGHVSGTPTQAGNFEFYVKIAEPQGEPGCLGSVGEKKFIIPIVPGLAKLTLGPESTSPGTVGTPYSLQMTATVADAKTWSIAAGALPPGVAIDAASGLISGTPTAAGQFDFTVHAKMNGDARTDTKALGIVVRDPVAIASSEPFTEARRAVGEVTAPFEAMLLASGGTGTYTWTLSSGTLPAGLLFAQGAISGTPRAAGSYAVTVTATDSEGRVANYPSQIVVMPQLAISTRLVKPGRVGKFFQRKLATLGGVKPAEWRLVRGPLPRGVFFDRTVGVLYGYPTRFGAFRVTFEATDTLGVKAKKTLRIVIAPALKPKRSG